jgi:hypothetical protein
MVSDGFRIYRISEQENAQLFCGIIPFAKYYEQGIILWKLQTFFANLKGLSSEIDRAKSGLI